jgi:UDP-GlcNAc3NAcA epimerase
MIKILTVVGARPQIIKAAAISRAITNSYDNKLNEIIVHTGQHYDSNMSQVFFDELKIPSPNFNLNVGSGSHGEQTASMILGLEKLMIVQKPDYVLVYGDTNSTLAAAVAASKIHIPIVHVEAGLRSFNKAMPEEINRIICDHSSTLLFSPTRQGYDNLIAEGFQKFSKPYSIDRPGIFHCGDVMYDNSIHFVRIASANSHILEQLNIDKNGFILATIHRADNTDSLEKLRGIFDALLKIVELSSYTIVIPLHPRTLKKLEDHNLDILNKLMNSSKIRLVDPVSFLEMTELEKNCVMVITDSGGVQKEAYFFQKPCVILRNETEWVEIVNSGCAVLAGSSYELILNAFEDLQNRHHSFPRIFGDGHAAEFICDQIIRM